MNTQIFNRSAILIYGLSLTLMAMPVFAQLPRTSSKAKQSPHKVHPDLTVLKTYVNYMLAKYSHPNLVSFLSVSETVPARRALLRHYAGRTPPILAAGSRVKYGAGFTDKRTGQAAIIYNVKAVKWLGNSKVEITGGWIRGGLAGIGAAYTLVQDQKGWRVSKERGLYRN